ncbi:substrate-binding periplasmic protein [Neptunicella sp. SCSIO 80796]|uniref:substrate-binding periplasmic protein n=1 Tax=Neptunicella plasticusilytica TaxID=3117012 RepID=UPI003A4DAAC8
MQKRSHITGIEYAKSSFKNVSLVLLVALLLLSPLTKAKPLLRSSVSPEFSQGLHAKYLQLIADKMEMKLDLYPMPFARRVVALKSGQIDLMVGMQRESNIQDEVIYIYPSYEKLRHTFFVLKEQQHQLKQFEDLQQMTIGVTIHAKYYQRFNQQADLALIAVSSLRQKIDLLMKGRIDSFIHYQESTIPVLKSMALDGEIVKSDYQPTEYHPYYVTISEKSVLFPLKAKLSTVIRTATENGEFARIRQEHYR